MTICEFIESEAPKILREKNKNYAEELQIAYNKFKDYDRHQLIPELDLARSDFKLNGRSDNNIARCMIIYALINEDLR